MISSHPSEPMVNKRDFPTPAHAMIETTFTSWFAHASSRKAISSSRPKTSLPVTGNLATEIFFGTDRGERDSRSGLPPGVFGGETFARPRMEDTNSLHLAGGLRVTTGEAAEGIFCKLCGVILHPASIAPVIVGIAFSSSAGF